METPATSQQQPRTLRATIVFACLAMLVSYLPFSAVNGALGTIGAATGASTPDLQWLTDAFALSLAATVLPAGVLGDLFGRRRIAVAGLGLTVAGSALAFGAGWLAGPGAIHAMWVAQALSGLGGGAVMSATLGLVSAAAPGAAKRSRAIAAWAAAVVVGLGGGPFLAGAITAGASWQWLFVPIAALALAVAGYGRNRSGEFSAPAGRRLDVPGQASSALGVLAIVFAVIRGGSAGWTDPACVAALCISVLAGVLRTAALVAVTLLGRPARPNGRTTAPPTGRPGQLVRSHS